MSGVEEHALYCPYCNERISILIDLSIEQQEYIEDCQVCCQPMLLMVSIGDQQAITVIATPENE